jgi:DNA-binding transcriptional ArsR family regulator
MTSISSKHFHKLEKIVRGFSNHRRIEIMHLLCERPELSLIEISEKLKIHFKTASEHVRRLALADIVTKRAEGHFVRHSLTDRGHFILKFLRTLE